MKNISDLREELEEIKETKEDLSIEIEELEDEIDNLESKKDRAENKFRKLEEKENELEDYIEKQVRELIKNKISQSSTSNCESHIFNAMLYTVEHFNTKEEYKKLYMSNNKIYSVDGYRIFEGICSNTNFEKDMCIDAKQVLDHGLKFELCQEINLNTKESKTLEVVKKQITKTYDKESWIINTTIDSLMNDYLYKAYQDKHLDILIFKFEDNLKIAFQRKFIEDAIETFKHDDINITYSDDINPIVIESKNKKIMVLPIKLADKNKVQ